MMICISLVVSLFFLVEYFFLLPLLTLILFFMKDFSFFFDGFFWGDNLSFLMIFITFYIFLVSLFSADEGSLSNFLFWGMLVFLCISFFTSNFFLFYFCFEFVFVLMFTFILGWGKSSERLGASFYMFFYTMFFSLPFFFMLLDVLFSLQSSNFLSFYFFHYSSEMWVFVFFVFSAKLPLFGLHSWLPKAHVESPLLGSMVLAGVLLKLGGYGILRFLPLLDFISFSSSLLINFFFYIALMGGVFISFSCFRQMDLKMLIAYSSVVHMSLMVLGSFSFSFLGVYGSILMMFAHGFVSPLLFFLMGFAYEGLFSRSLMILKGVLALSPLLGVFWLIGSCLNYSFPPFMSFISEISVISSISCFSFFEWFFLFLLCFFTGVYCIYMFTSLLHWNFNSFYFLNFSIKEMMTSVSLVSFVLSFTMVFFY